MENKKPSLIEEIRSQPDHIRKIMMWLSVFVTVALVGSFWINNTKDQLALLTDPRGYEIQKQYALEQKEKERRNFVEGGSPFAMISEIFFDLRANIGDFVRGESIDIKETSEVKSKIENKNKDELKATSRPSLPLIDNY